MKAGFHLRAAGASQRHLGALQQPSPGGVLHQRPFAARCRIKLSQTQKPGPLSNTHETPLTLVAQAAAGEVVLPASLDSTTANIGGQAEARSPWERLKDWVTGAQYKEKLGQLGMAAFLSYGVLSNITYALCLTFAWVSFVKQRGVTPLETGQYAPFLAFYAGLWAIQNVVRPARFALSIATAPAFDRSLDWIAAWCGCDKKGALAITMVLMSILTPAIIFAGIYLFGGLPDGLGPFPPLRRF